ncbi:uncharacterized protein LOC135961012 [Calliphora vicina]|uniref:uncharacterized protein LOC135961012 n=1 Tax=Calliphora vicina TaxID=7373 RepID=UPI00325C2BAC
MKCCSRSTLGITIGSLNVLGYILCTIFSIIAVVQINAADEQNQQQKEEFAVYKTLFIVLIVVCLIMILISGLLITGIVKRRHKMMLPWLILSGIGFVINCARFGYLIIVAIIQGIPLATVIFIFILGLLGIAISALILWPIYTLYRDMRKENSEMPGRVMNSSSQVEYQTSPSYYKT